MRSLSRRLSIFLVLGTALGCGSDGEDPPRFDEFPQYGGKVEGLLTMTPDGRFVAMVSAAAKNRIEVKSLPEGNVVAEVTAGGFEEEYVSSLRLTPSGSHLVSAHGTWMPIHLIAWELPSGREVGRVRLEQGLAQSGLAMSRDGRLVVAPTYGNEVLVLTLPGLGTKAVFRGDGARMSGADLSPDGQRLAACDEAGTLFVWDVESGEQVARKSLARPGEGPALHDAKYGPGGVLAVFRRAGEEALLLLDPTSLETRRAISKSWGPYDFSPDGKEVAIGGQDSYALALVYDVATGEEVQTLGQPTGGPIRIVTIGLRTTWLQYIEDGKTIAMKDNEDQTRFYRRLEK